MARSANWASGGSSTFRLPVPIRTTVSRSTVPAYRAESKSWTGARIETSPRAWSCRRANSRWTESSQEAASTVYLVVPVDGRLLDDYGPRRNDRGPDTTRFRVVDSHPLVAQQPLARRQLALRRPRFNVEPLHVRRHRVDRALVEVAIVLFIALAGFQVGVVRCRATANQNGGSQQQNGAVSDEHEKRIDHGKNIRQTPKRVSAISLKT